MGNRASPCIAFGFPLGAEEDLTADLEGFAELVEDSDDLKDEGWPVEIVSHGHHEYRFLFLSVRGTRYRGGDWGSMLTCPTTPPDATKIEAARTWCEANGIEWRTPEWVAMATYS